MTAEELFPSLALTPGEWTRLQQAIDYPDSMTPTLAEMRARAHLLNTASCELDAVAEAQLAFLRERKEMSPEVLLIHGNRLKRCRQKIAAALDTTVEDLFGGVAK